MIPKIIHYCWFGRKKKSRLVRDCIKSWKKYLPDYQIIEWNEKNSDLSHPFVKEAYLLKKWAFVADFVRLNVLCEKGGIYLDTDMMVLRSFNNLLDNQCFFGAEDEEYISCGIIGSIPNFQFISQCKSLYNEILNFENLGIITIPRIITKQFRQHFNFNDNFNQIIVENDIKIFPFEYFYPLPFKDKNNVKNYMDYIKVESYAVHLWNSSWFDYSEFYYIRKKEYINGFYKMIQHIYHKKEFKYSYFRKIASSLKESLKN